MCMWRRGMCAHLYEYRCQGGQERVPDTSGGGVTGGCEPPDMGSRNQTQVL